MPTSAKRFYLCNLIPLWNVDEEGVDVDWPIYTAYFDDTVVMRADVMKRSVVWTSDGGVTVSPDLKIRFEVYESDYLLFGGLNDHMGTFSSHADYGDNPTVLPIKIVPDVDKIEPEEELAAIYIQWVPGHKTTLTVVSGSGTTTSSSEDLPDTLKIRCWWKVKQEEDVSGDPEFYYDFYAEGELANGDTFKLHERSDNELVGISWSVTKNVRPGRVTPLVDGEYAMIKMLQLLDRAAHNIHILSWKMDPSATLLVDQEFQADYAQVPGIDAAEYKALLSRNKTRPVGVATRKGAVVFGCSNGNLMMGAADDIDAKPLVRYIDSPTNLDLPAGLVIVDDNMSVLVLDALRSRLLLFMVLPRDQLVKVDEGVFVARFSATRARLFFQTTPTLPSIAAHPELVAGFFAIAGQGNPGFKDGGLANGPLVGITGQFPVGNLNRPGALALALGKIYITDTYNHCVRVVSDFDPADLIKTLKESALMLATLAGTNSPGAADGAHDVARFNKPTGIVWDSLGSRLLVADSGNKRIRAIDPAIGAVTTLAIGEIDGVAGALGQLSGLAFDPATGPKGTLFAAEQDKHRILAIDLDTLKARLFAGGTRSGFSDGRPTDALFNTPTDIAFDSGVLVVADSLNHLTRVIDVAGNWVHSIGDRHEGRAQDIPVQVADVLKRKADEGVQVRILMDGLGSGFGRDEWSRNPAAIYVQGPQTESDLRYYHPDIHAFVQHHPQSLGKQTIATFHEKMMVVDGKSGIAGGIDFAPDKNDGLRHDRKHRTSMFWHDVVALVEGKAAYGLEEHFARRWAMAVESLKDKPVEGAAPAAYVSEDKTDATIMDTTAEIVRTYDPTPVFGPLVNLVSDEVTEVLDSYRRAIRAARNYIYLEHQYIYYPEIGEYIADAMKENPNLQVIWTIPFFTEESRDPLQEQAAAIQQKYLATVITDTKLAANPGGGIKTQMTWHGLFRQHEMVEKLRKVDPKRFGVFSVRRPFIATVDSTEPESEPIYPHTKMILCDDRFFSIGSANANGRGFVKDGEVNVSTLSREAAKALRMRLWGEHLGYLGLAVPGPAGSGEIVPVSGHHLSPRARIVLQHPSFGLQEREVDTVNPSTGGLTLKDGPIDPHIERVWWQDPTLADLPLGGVLDMWRRSAHSLDTYRKVQGSHATTDKDGNLIVPGNLAKKDYKLRFGSRLIKVSDGGFLSSSDPQYNNYEVGVMTVKGSDGTRIELAPLVQTVPDAGKLKSMAVGATETVAPFLVRVASRAGGNVTLEITLLPNLKDVPFDYEMSWLLDQPGNVRLLRAWEIDPPNGVQYGGPLTMLFSPWWLVPWLFADFDPDELAVEEARASDVLIV